MYHVKLYCKGKWFEKRIIYFLAAFESSFIYFDNYLVNSHIQSLWLTFWERSQVQYLYRGVCVCPRMEAGAWCGSIIGPSWITLCMHSKTRTWWSLVDLATKEEISRPWCSYDKNTEVIRWEIQWSDGSIPSYDLNICLKMAIVSMELFHAPGH